MTVSVEVASWNKLATFLQTEFYQPDLEALRIVLAACRSHYYPGDPIWLFVIGPSGSGKTSIVINSVSALPNCWVESSISPKTLLSCASVGDNTSLLLRIGSGILAFKDFTTIISKNEESQREIVSQLREVYDGSYKSKTGVEWREWNGKITVIAAVTPAIERAWVVHRDLGERFLQVRWPNSDGRKVAEIARRQRGREKQISDSMKALTKAFFRSSGPTPNLSDPQGYTVDCIATVVAQLRANVHRENKEIIDTAQPEEPSRLAKSISSIICHHAALFNRECESEDMKAGIRLALDTIPQRRVQVLKAIPLTETINTQELCALTQIPRGSINRPLDDLEALGVIEQTEDIIVGKKVTFTSIFRELWSFIVSPNPYDTSPP